MEVVPVGGFFTYIMFPDSLSDADVVAKRAADEYNLVIAPGQIFAVRKDDGSLARVGAKGGFGRGARLCWA